MDTRFLICCLVVVCVTVADDPTSTPAPTQEAANVPGHNATANATQNATQEGNATAVVPSDDPVKEPEPIEGEKKEADKNGTVVADSLDPNKGDPVKEMAQKETETETKTETEAKIENETETNKTDAQKEAESQLSELENGQTDNNDHELLLTPWWDLEMGVGETVEVDCGVFTGGKPDTMTLQWLRPNGTVIEAGERTTLRRKDQNPNQSTYGAFSVLTLTLSDLDLEDGGTYTCQCTHKVGEESHTAQRNIALSVLPSSERCNFESSDLCGWKVTESDVEWHRHNATDTTIQDRSRGPRHDHTYGLSKHTGHFLDVDVQHGSLLSKDGKATLLSPVYQPHELNKCLQFWYMFDGTDQEHLAVLLKPDGVEVSELDDSKATLFKETEHKGTSWQLAKVDIPKQDQQYELVYEVLTCTDKCQRAATAIDDIRISTGSCADTNTPWPDTQLQLRLVDGEKTTEGRVEVLHDGEYGTICSDQFGDKDAKVICSILGFGHTSAVGKRAAFFGPAPKNYMIWLNRVGCTESDEDILQCLQKNESWGETESCTHDNDASVICDDAVTTVAPKQPTVQPPTEPKANVTQPTVPATNQTATNDTKSATPTPEKPLPETDGPKINGTTKEGVNDSSAAINKPEVVNKKSSSHKGVVTGVIIGVVLVVFAAVYVVYRSKRKHKKSKYLNFGNPSYSTEHLPSNDFNLESPLTLSSSGYTVLA